MTHFGIVCPNLTGHLNPMTTLGYELKSRGHRVTLCSILDAQSKVEAAELEFLAIGESEFPRGWSAQRDARQGKLSGLAAMRYSIDCFKDLTAMSLQQLPFALQQAGIEALLVDQGITEGGTVAEFLDIPFVTICSAMMLNIEDNIPPFFTTWTYHPAWWTRLRNRAAYKLLNSFGRSVLELIAEYRRKWNLPLHSNSNQNYSQLAQISQQVTEFEFPRQDLPQCFHFTGPFSNPASRTPVLFPFEKLTGQPLIYASMGTWQNGMSEVFQKIAEGCVGLDAQLVISLGGSLSPESLPIMPGNPLVVGYAPQLELLQRATLTITHAGLNTVMESLNNGVPMVAIPVANDQPGVAARIAWTGTGEVIPLSKLEPTKLHSVVKQVLAAESYKNNALRLQSAIQQAGGVSRAADIVETAVSSRRPVLSHR